MYTVHALSHLVEHNQTWAYLVIFFGLIFEGEVVVITAGVLAQLGALNFWAALIFVLLGGFTKTITLYYLGGVLHKKHNDKKLFQYFEKRIKTFMPRFEQKPFWSIFIAKFIMGVDYIVMIFAGYKKINFKTYLKAEVSSIIIWAPLLLSLGYFFSYTAIRISREIWKFSLIVLLLVIGFIIFDKLVGWLVEVFEEFYE
jgi:membrane-associated protein